MALWDGYLDCWNDFKRRLDYGAHLIRYLKSNTDKLQPSKTRHVLSIGPGTGEIDVEVLKLLPHAVTYTGVDPDKDVLDTLTARLEEFPHLEKTFVNGKLESYEGPTNPPDLVIMSHVAYYFADYFPLQMLRVVAWLNKEHGRILLVHEHNTVHERIASAFDVNQTTFDLITVNQIRNHLKDMNLKFSEEEVPYFFDVSQSGNGSFDFVSIFLNRRATEEEVQKAITLIREVAIPGTQKVQNRQSVMVIYAK